MKRKLLGLGYFILTLALLYNMLQIKSLLVGIILGLAYLIIFSLLAGQILWPGQEKSWQISLGSLTLLSAYSLLGTIIYYCYKLDLLLISILVLSISAIIIYLSYQRPTPIFKLPRLPVFNLTTFILSASYLLLFFVALVLVWQGRTESAINSPWQMLPSYFFIIYFLATLNLLTLIFYKPTPAKGLFVVLHYFLTSTIALLIYKLGFGFDPFIHQATEQVIWQNGFILPKPFYYIGQYSIVVIFSHLMQISVVWLDKLLLPILLCLNLPVIIYYSLKKSFNWSDTLVWLGSLSFFLLPFTLFIATNPQALANLLSLIIIFLSLIYLQKKQISLLYLFFLTLVTLAIHPLSGIPILIYLIILWQVQQNFKFKKVVLTIFILLSALALPGAILLNTLVSIYKINFNFQTLDLPLLPSLVTKQFNYFSDWAYLYKDFIYLIIFIAALVALIYFTKRKISTWLPFILTFLVLLTNAVLLQFVKVNDIIAAEQNEFSKRVSTLAFYFLLPLIIYALTTLYLKVQKQSALIKISFILFVTIFITASFYLSYPRFDHYEDSKFINLTNEDLEIVKYIEEHKTADYIVLANQMTSAAAVKLFGFNRYYNGQYFYPIPTGGLLYQYFIKMTEATDKQYMIEAMDLAGVKEAYFVLPAYWSKFEQISAKAAKDATQIINLSDRIYLYKYQK